MTWARCAAVEQEPTEGNAAETKPVEKPTPAFEPTKVPTRASHRSRFRGD